jgi:hypothetical protein
VADASDAAPPAAPRLPDQRSLLEALSRGGEDAFMTER